MVDTTDKDAGTIAQSRFVELSSDADFLLPDVNLGDANYQFPNSENNPLYTKVSELTNEDLTTRVVGGTGTFDALMASVSAHLKVEYEKNRLSGKEYSEAYVAITANALQTAMQFLLQKDQSYWQALLVQSQARQAEVDVITSRINLEVAKATLATNRYQAYNAKAQYALTKMQLAIGNGQFDVTYQQLDNAKLDGSIKTYSLNTDMPLATKISQANLDTMEVDKNTKLFSLNTLMPAQATLLKSQNSNMLVDTQTKTYSLNSILPQQKNLLVEQTESARAETLTTRLSDGSLITGTKGKQRDLYEQQITSYERDAEAKVARIFADMWITRKTLDEGLVPPTSMSDSNYNSVLDGMRTKVGF